ncbi:GTP binding protein [Aureococcus anophagefferens]|nr:GTP binding protein [Aureococcus anophagefferens]
MCHALQVHGQIHKRGIYVVNLDPAAELTPYEADVDIRELITIEDAMKEMGYGPNGGLVYCMEYMLANFDWLESKLAALQQNLNISCCSTFLVDAVSIHEPSKFVAGALAGLSAMLQLPVPHVTVLSKSDMIKSEEQLEKFLDEGSAALFVRERNRLDNAEPGRTPNLPYERLHAAICSVLDDHSMLSCVPFTVNDEDASAVVLAFCDHLTQ